MEILLLLWLAQLSDGGHTVVPLKGCNGSKWSRASVWLTLIVVGICVAGLPDGRRGQAHGEPMEESQARSPQGKPWKPRLSLADFPR